MQRQVEHAQAAQAEQRQADATQNMQRTLAEPGEKADGQEVEKPLEKPREPVLRRAVPPAPMADLDLGDTKAAGVRQHRNETVQLAVNADLAQHLASVKLESAIVIVQAAAA